MIISAILAGALLQGANAKPVTLDRVFKKGEKAEYKVLSSLQLQTRQGELDTFMPEDIDFRYNFTYEVTEVRPGGYAVLRYKRPTMIQTDGETVDSPPKDRVIKSNLDYLLTLSPINEITDTKDMAKKEPEKKPTSKPPAKGKGGLSYASPLGTGAAQFDSSFLQEIYRLALFIGSLDSAMDFSPKLPLDEVTVGEKWQKTVGYSPQIVKGSSEKQAVQRLDYTYEYTGLKTINGKPFETISATLNLDTDIAPFIHQISNMTPTQTGLKEWKLKLDAKIDFRLDPKTRRTVRADAVSSGGMELRLTRDSRLPYVEQKINGKTTMVLVSASP